MFLNEDGLLHYMTVGYGCASWWVIWTQGIFYYKNKLIKLSCLLVSLYFAIFILNYGNRGALVVIVVALAVLMMVYIPLKYLVLLGVVILLATSAAFLFLQPLMELAGDLLGFDLTLSRNFRLLSNGLLGYDSGRLPIYRVCFEAILQRLFTDYGLTMNFEQYVLVGSTVRSYLAWLKDSGKVNALFENNMLLWQRI